MICHEIKKLCSKSFDELKLWYKEISPTLEHNRQTLNFDSNSKQKNIKTDVKRNIMKNIIDTWNKDGYVNVPIFTKDEIDKIRTRGLELLNERDPNWRDNLPTGSEPYQNPHFQDDMFYEIIRKKEIVDIVKRLIQNENTNLGDFDLEVSQTWMYFKPPGELGRDTHQNSFYVHCDWKPTNISIH